MRPILIFLISTFGLSAQTAPLRVRLVTGGHTYQTSFYKLVDYDDFQVTVAPHPGAYTGDFRERTDVLVLYDMVQSPTIGEEGKKFLRQYVESGKGLVILHHAVLDYHDWDWWTQEVSGIGRQPGARDSATHDLDLALQVVNQHPLLKGVNMPKISDEAYKGLTISPKNTLLLRTDHKASDGPVAWISSYPKARVFVTSLGHGPEAHKNPGLQRLIRNAILWSAGRLN